MTTITCIEDLQRLAKKRVPKMFYEYAASGSWTEQTLRENVEAYSQLRLRQKVAVDMTDRSVATQMVGQDVRMPVALAPVGLLGMQHADGEIHAARAAEKFGVPFTMSTMSVCSLEDIAENTTKPFWFQLYVMRDRDYIGRLIDRAKDAGCSALILTLDLQILGQRHADIKNGLGVPPDMTIKNLMQMMARPRWCMNMLKTKRHQFGNIQGHVKGVENMNKLSEWTSSQFDPTLNWRDIDWIRERWGGKLILKGILDADDAKMAVKTGADAIVVSNHGGRQLDGAMSSLSMLPEIAEAIDGQSEIILDGGIRSGQDVLKAMALGADSTLLGRAYCFGLGAMGELGVTKTLEIIEKELDTTMALVGRKKIQDVCKDDLIFPDEMASRLTAATCR